MAARDELPQVHSELEAEGIPDMDAPPPNTMEAGDTYEGFLPPRDHPIAALDYGTTAAELATPEPLAQWVEREEPDPLRIELDQPDATPRTGGYATAQGLGRIVDPESEVDVLDVTAESVAFDVGADGGGFSAEEAAMHVTDERLTDEP